MPIALVVHPTDLGSEFDQGVATPNKITVVNATDAVAGKVKLSKAASYPANTDALLSDSGLRAGRDCGITG